MREWRIVYLRSRPPQFPYEILSHTCAWAMNVYFYSALSFAIVGVVLIWKPFIVQLQWLKSDFKKYFNHIASLTWIICMGRRIIRMYTWLSCKYPIRTALLTANKMFFVAAYSGFLSHSSNVYLNLYLLLLLLLFHLSLDCDGL